MIRAMLVAIIALFALSFTPISSAHEVNDGDGVVWGTASVDGDGVVWGTSCTDPSCQPVMWGRE